MAQSESQIIVYGTTWCPDCTRAKRYFDQRGIPYQWIDVDRDAAAREYIIKLNGGMRRVPTILFPDGSILVEPTNVQLADKLGQTRA